MNDHPSLRPLGWEGTLPDEGISGPDVLLRYLSTRLDKVRLFGNRRSGVLAEVVHPDFTQEYYHQARQALRNALRGFDYLELNNRVSPWPRDEENLSHHELEYRLSEVVRCLSKQVAQNDDQAIVTKQSQSPLQTCVRKSDSNNVPQTSEMNSTNVQSKSHEYMGGKKLTEHLGIPADQFSAFHSFLSRNREKLGDEYWIETSNSKSREPRYLYRVDCPVLLERAKKYRE